MNKLSLPLVSVLPALVVVTFHLAPGCHGRPGDPAQHVLNPATPTAPVMSRNVHVYARLVHGVYAVTNGSGVISTV